MDDQIKPESLKEAVDTQLSNAFGMTMPKEAVAVIEDMLAWQKEMDNAPASINMRGTKRLFITISHHLGRDVYINASPDPTQITIPLTDTVGIQITAEAVDCFDPQPDPGEPEVTWSGRLNIRLVSLAGKEWYTA